MRSSTRSIPTVFSFSTSSSPRRKISSSLLFTRNSCGSLTAWLFPDLNTRAVAISDSLPRIYAQYIRNHGLSFLGWGRVIFPGCAARAASKASLEKGPTERWIIGLNDELQFAFSSSGTICRAHFLLPSLLQEQVSWKP